MILHGIRKVVADLVGRAPRRTTAPRDLVPLVVVVCCLVPGAGSGGCAPSPRGATRQTVAAELRDRSGHTFLGGRPPGDFAPLRPGSRLSEADAVDLALLHNAAFREQLAELGLTRADLVQAGLIANPEGLLLFPVGPKQLEATVAAPLESLWLRGPRTEAARLANDATAARLAQAGLDLIRDVRLAYAEVVLAERRLALVLESQRLREQVAKIAKARVDGGDAVPLDAATARIDAIRAGQEANSLRHAVTIAAERLRAVIGAGAVRTDLAVDPLPDGRPAEPDVEELVSAALAGRPDLRAAGLAVEAARNRAALARVEWLNLALIADANERGLKGFEVGPGLRFTLPIFNQNQGQIARADAEVERAVRQQRTLNDRVILDVREAHTRYRQAREDLTAWRTGILPALEQAVGLAERSYRNGETPLVQVLDTNRQLLEAQAREAQSATDARRAWADLERSAGRRLDTAGPSAAPATAVSRAATSPTPSTAGTTREGIR